MAYAWRESADDPSWKETAVGASTASGLAEDHGSAGRRSPSALAWCGGNVCGVALLVKAEKAEVCGKTEGGRMFGSKYGLVFVQAWIYMF